MSAPSLQEFIHTTTKSGGLGKNNLFYVMFSDDSKINGVDGVTSRDMALLCHEAVIPGVTVLSQPFKIYGLPTEMPYEIGFEQVRFSFYVDAGHAVIKTFHDLVDQIIDPTSWTPNYRSDYAFNKIEIMTINQKSENQYDSIASRNPTESITYSLYDAFVKTVQSVPLSWKTVNQVMEVTIEVSYRYMALDDSRANKFQGNQMAEQRRAAADAGINGMDLGDVSPGEMLPGQDVPVPGEDIVDDSRFMKSITTQTTHEQGLIYDGSQYWSGKDPAEGLDPSILNYEHAPDPAAPADLPANIFTDSSGIGSTFSNNSVSWDSFTSQKMDQSAIKWPTDTSNPISGVKIDPQNMYTTVPGGINSPVSAIMPKMPVNFSTVNAINPAAASSFQLSSITAPIKAVSTQINSITNAMRGVTRVATSEVGKFLAPINEIQKAVASVGALNTMIKRTLGNLPATVKSQVTGAAKTLASTAKGLGQFGQAPRKAPVTPSKIKPKSPLLK